MAKLLPQDARRAALSAGLLASDQDGEVIAAARALVCLLRKADLDPAGVVSAGLLASAQILPMRLPAARHRPLNERARVARHSPHINRCERDFLTGMMDRSRLSQSEAAKLQAILRKSEGAGL